MTTWSPTTARLWVLFFSFSTFFPIVPMNLLNGRGTARVSGDAKESSNRTVADFGPQLMSKQAKEGVGMEMLLKQLSPLLLKASSILNADTLSRIVVQLRSFSNATV